jgi:hypothetical protein
MGWSGRAPAPVMESWRGTEDKEHAMSSSQFRNRRHRYRKPLDDLGAKSELNAQQMAVATRSLRRLAPVAMAGSRVLAPSQSSC